jgi:hypothetical protein
VSIREGNKPPDTTRHWLTFVDAELGHFVLFEEDVQSFYNVEILCARIAPPKATKGTQTVASLLVGHGLCQMD